MAELEEEHEYDTGGNVREWHTGGRRISWGAIFAGAFVTLAIFLTLQMLGAGIGAASIDLTGRQTTSARSLGIGAAIWWFVIGLISLFAGGWVAGRLGWRPNKTDRILHGLTVWSLFYVVMFLLAVTALGALAGGGISLLGSGVSAAGQAAASSPQAQQTVQQALESWGLSPDIIQQEITKAMGPGASQQNEQGAKDLATVVSNYFRSGKTPEDRQQLVQTITATTGMSEAQANRMIDNLDRTVQQAKATGEKAANITGATFIGLAISMILGAVAAMLGSLVAPAPPFIPAYERQRDRSTKTGAGTYASR
jgi:hypothetical protein